MTGENSSFTAGTERKPRFLPEQLPHVGREPPARLTHTHSTSKQNVLKKQLLLETATFISKPALPWIYISSDYSIPCWWSLLSWPGSKTSSVPSSSEIVKKSSGYQDAKQILKNRQEPWILEKSSIQLEEASPPQPSQLGFFSLLNLLHSSQFGQAWDSDPPAIKAGTPFTEPEEPVLSLFSEDGSARRLRSRCQQWCVKADKCVSVFPACQPLFSSAVYMMCKLSEYFASTGFWK